MNNFLIIWFKYAADVKTLLLELLLDINEYSIDHFRLI